MVEHITLPITVITWFFINNVITREIRSWSDFKVLQRDPVWHKYNRLWFSQGWFVKCRFNKTNWNWHFFPMILIWDIFCISFLKICHTSVCQPLTRCEHFAGAVLVLSFHTAAALSNLSLFINFCHFTTLTNMIHLLPLRAWPEFDSLAPSCYLFFSCLFCFLQILEPFLGLNNHKSTCFTQDSNLLWIFIESSHNAKVGFFKTNFSRLLQFLEAWLYPCCYQDVCFWAFAHSPMDNGTCSSTVDQNSHLPLFWVHKWY